MDLSGVDVFDLLARMDITGVRSASGGSEANFSCPFPGHSHGDENPSAYMNIETTAWFCWGCKRRGNAVTFYVEHQSVSRATAERFMRDTYGIEFLEPAGGSMISETEARFAAKIEPLPPMRPSQSFQWSQRVDWEVEELEPAHQYMLDRGFYRDVLAAWDIGYDYLSDRLTVPIFDLSNELVGLKARAWRDDQEPKYLALGDRRQPRFGFTPYDPTHVVFGLHRERDCKRVVHCEGELNAVALSQLGVERPTASGMSYFPERHAELLVREADEVVLFFDPDPAGRGGVDGTVNSAGQRMPGARELLEPHMRVRVVHGHDADPAKMLQQGRGDEVLELIESSPSSLALSTSFR